MDAADIIFKNLGITIMKMDPIAFSIFGLDIYWYALFIATGFIGGLVIATILAKKSGQRPEIYSDYLFFALIAAIVGARLYYVAFEWDAYKDDLMKIFRTRDGGLAIYGGIIAVVITLYIFTKVKKLSFWLMGDTAVAGLAFGQMIGRMGNFVNMEAFGGYTNNIFAMSLKTTSAKYVPIELMDKLTIINGVEYMQVHPTFLYEAIWTGVLMIFLLWNFKRRKFDGENVLLYFLGYGLGRIWIEGLRTDQLIIGSTGIPASQLLAGIIIVVSFVTFLIKRREYKQKTDN